MLLVLVAAAFASCGDDGGEDEVLDPERAARIDFEATVNSLCDRFRARLRKVEGARTTRDYGRWAHQSSAVLVNGISELEKAKRPESARTDYQRYLELGRQQIRWLGVIERAGPRGQVSGVKTSLQEIRDIDEESDAIATRLGLGRCVGG